MYANNTPNVRHISWCFRSQFVFAGWDPKNLTATTENSNICLHGPVSTFNSMVGIQILHTMVGTQLHLFQNLPNLRTIASGHDVIHTPFSIFYLGFIMSIVISFARERKLYPMLCTWIKSRKVQSPTKLNYKI